MKKIIPPFILPFLLLLPVLIKAQNFSKEDVDFIKWVRKSAYTKMYTNDSMISKTVDPATILPWQSPALKNTDAIIDSLHATIKSDVSSEYISLYGLFPKGIIKQDCDLFKTELISYSIVNEKNQKVQIDTGKVSVAIGQYYKNNEPVRYTLDFKLPKHTEGKTYKGFIEYEISAPAEFNTVTITKSDIGKKYTINNHVFTVIAFTKNYVALKADSSIKNIDFDFSGTDAANKKYKQKFVQMEGYKTALGKSSFVISEEMYTYYINHPKLSDEELNTYINDYINNHERELVVGEAQILVIQDIGYMEKMFCYWPASLKKKRFKQEIDLRYF
ncbi:MAG: hypothetical protein ACTHJT_15205 [Cytophaga sp.]|uniref:hypothetical protein n=1 Tax=Cytophaga sp. TaxID=29535 RepID=UPI003F7DE882